MLVTVAWMTGMLLAGEQVLACNLFQGRSLSCKEAKELLDLHNLKRQEVATGKYEATEKQPKAEDMRELKWDTGLARQAQDYANRCVYQHDTTRPQDVAECLAEEVVLKTEGYNLTKLTYMWFDELFQYGYNGTFSYEVGHYLAMIWASFKHIGCGLSLYEAKEPFREDYSNAFLVCRYKPHLAQDYAYTRGAPACRKHGMEDSVRHPGLCSQDPPAAQREYNPCQGMHDGAGSGGGHRSSDTSTLPYTLLALSLILSLFT